MCHHVGVIRTQIQLTETQLGALRRLAANNGVSIADLIRRSVDSYLAAHTAERSREERIERALSATGKFASGARDVSAEHDGYLAQAFEK